MSIDKNVKIDKKYFVLYCVVVLRCVALYCIVILDYSEKRYQFSLKTSTLADTREGFRLCFDS